MKSKAFTIVEMMISLLIFSIVLAGALSFLVHHSRVALETRATKLVTESANAALRIIANDVMHAGSGVADPLSSGSDQHPQLGLYIDVMDESQELYLNWTGFLNYDAVPADGLPVNSVFRVRGYADLNTPASNFTLLNVPDSVKTATDIGGLIVTSKNGTWAESTKVTSGDKKDGTQSLTFEIIDKEGGAPKTIQGQVAPAIVYRWVKNSEDKTGNGGQLFRNSVALLGDKPDANGRMGGNQFKVTGFNVQCKFVDSTNQVQWSKKGSHINGFKIADLKLVRVIIDYSWKSPYYGIHNSSSSLDIAPRGLVKIGG